MIGGALLGAGKYINGLVPSDDIHEQFDLTYSNVLDITVHQGRLITLRKNDVRVHDGMGPNIAYTITGVNGDDDAGVCVVGGDLVIVRPSGLYRYDGISGDNPTLLFNPAGSTALTFDGQHYIVSMGGTASEYRFRRYSQAGVYQDGFVSFGDLNGDYADAHGVSWTGKYYVSYCRGVTRIHDVDLTQIGEFGTRNDPNMWRYAQNGRRAIRIKRRGSTVQILENE